MDSKLVSFLKPSKAIIYDLDNCHCCVISVSKTGHPVTRDYLKIAYSKMEAVSDYEHQEALMYSSEGQADFFVRLRSIEIDDSNVLSATMYIDIIVRPDMTQEDIKALTDEVQCGLSPILSIDGADKFGAACYLAISVKPAHLSSPSFHPGMDVYYEDYI